MSIKEDAGEMIHRCKELNDKGYASMLMVADTETCDFVMEVHGPYLDIGAAITRYLMDEPGMLSVFTMAVALAKKRRQEV